MKYERENPMSTPTTQPVPDETISPDVTSPYMCAPNLPPEVPCLEVDPCLPEGLTKWAVTPCTPEPVVTVLPQGPVAYAALPETGPAEIAGTAILATVILLAGLGVRRVARSS